MASKSARKQRPVIVCTEYRAVVFGYATNTDGDPIKLTRARMAIHYGTTKGLFELSETGPTSKSHISARADIELRKITCVLEVTPAALEVWEATK